MSVLDRTKWRCNDCNAHLRGIDLLTTPNPFDPGQMLTGCPRCKQCDEGFTILCDEPGCRLDGTCGWPTGDAHDAFDGYRHTCFRHSDMAPPP